jgi:hypothetical protein
VLRLTLSTALALAATVAANAQPVVQPPPQRVPGTPNVIVKPDEAICLHPANTEGWRQGRLGGCVMARRIILVETKEHPGQSC